MISLLRVRVFFDEKCYIAISGVSAQQFIHGRSKSFAAPELYLMKCVAMRRIGNKFVLETPIAFIRRLQRGSQAWNSDQIHLEISLDLHR